jgi:hypothetical protein
VVTSEFAVVDEAALTGEPLPAASTTRPPPHTRRWTRTA